MDHDVVSPALCIHRTLTPPPISPPFVLSYRLRSAMRTLSTTWKKLQILPMKRKAEKNTRKKVENDSNAPKRPPTAFFFFMEDFMKTYTESFPDMKSGSVTTKFEKAPRVEKAAEMKAEYEKPCKEYFEKSNGCGVFIAPEDSLASTSSVIGYDADQEDSS